MLAWVKIYPSHTGTQRPSRRTMLAMKRRVIPGVLLLVATGCLMGQANSNNSPPSQTSQSEENTSPADVYEAVVRYQIKSWELAAAAYCVKINGRDADKIFLNRFHPLPVKGASACREDAPRLEFPFPVVVDKQTRKNSVIFDVGRLRWLNQSAVEVDGGYLCASECMAEGTYHVLWDGTRWTVAAFDIHIQS
jgi:hypothetical protein